VADRLAVVVAVDRYDSPALQRLVAPAADAEALASVLGDPELGEFAVDVVHNPTSWEVAHRVEDLFADRRPDDTVLLHFSGHGLKDAGGRLYLAATNTKPERLASTAVAATWLNNVMQDSRARRILLLLDCCYGGAFERGVLPRAGGGADVGDQFRQDHLGGGRGRVIITASTAMEYAFEGANVAGGGSAVPSVFTGALAEGIRTGDADRDQDGRIGLGELYDYVYDQVRARSPRQTPGKWEFGLHGGFYLARSPRRRGSGRLPPELTEAVESPTTFVRFGAVDELARLAAGADLTLAAAARPTLQRLVGDDSSRVATAAAAALSDTAVGLSAASLPFGRVRAGTAPTVAELGVVGPPLALVSTVTVSDRALQARLDGATLRITWIPEWPGHLDATVTLAGPAGEAQVRVTGEAVAEPVPVIRPPEQAVATRQTIAAGPPLPPGVAEVAVRMPRLGEGNTEGTVTRWLKAVGDTVEVDEPLLEVETDKIDTEIPSPVAGILRRIIVGENEVARVGAELAIIGRPPTPQHDGAAPEPR
jgi:biotin carboxyl carrier protein